MQSSLFPKTKRQVSKLGFGAFGLKGVFGSFDESEAIGTMEYWGDQGVNCRDTARHYGESETIVGKALKSWSGDTPFIATKAECIGPIMQWGIPQDVEACFPKGHITREADISLRELGIECIDLFQMHLYGPNWGVDGHWLVELNALQQHLSLNHC